MTRDRSANRRFAAAPSPTDIARYEAAVAAAADPNGLMDEATGRFSDMARLAAAGDRLAVLGAANGVSEACLQLCTVPASSFTAAENKSRFLAIVAGWAWPRRPALAAVIDAAREAERQAWGGAVVGTIGTGEFAWTASRHAAASGRKSQGRRG